MITCLSPDANADTIPFLPREWPSFSQDQKKLTDNRKRIGTPATKEQYKDLFSYLFTNKEHQDLETKRST